MEALEEEAEMKASREEAGGRGTRWDFKKGVGKREYGEQVGGDGEKKKRRELQTDG